MGLLSKIWKGLKGTVKKIGSGIKKAYNKFGKFMGKLGIAGQVAMFFILPYVGGALFSNISSLASWGIDAGGAIGKIAEGAAWTLGKAKQFSQFVGKTFNTITKPVTEFFKTVGNYAGSKLQALNIPMPKSWNIPQNYTLEQAKNDWWQKGVTDNFHALGEATGNLFSKSIESALPDIPASIKLSDTETLVSDAVPMTPSQEGRFGKETLRENYRIVTQAPAPPHPSHKFPGGPRVDPSIETIDEDRVREILKHTKDGVYKAPDPKASKTLPQKAKETAMALPRDIYDATTATLKRDAGLSLLSGRKVGTLAYFDDPDIDEGSRRRGTFQGEPAPIAGDQDFRSFMSLSYDSSPTDTSGLWGGRSNYQTYMNRFGPQQSQYA